VGTRAGGVGHTSNTAEDKRLTVDRRHGNHVLHQRSKLPLQVILKNLRSSHGLIHRNTRDIPSIDDKVVGVDHWQHLGNGDKDIFTGFGIGTQSDGRSSDQGTDVVGFLDSVLGMPRDVVLVGEMGSENGGTVVSTEADKEETDS